MAAKRVTIAIDREHSLDLLAGKPVTIKVPDGAKELTLKCAAVRESSFAEVCDVFFNGRAARA